LQKQKAKSSRRTAPASQAQGTNANNWRLSDYAKLFQLKAEECEAAFASEREALERSIQQALEARAATQSELNSILHEKQQLTATINEQQSKVAVYEAKIKTFKTFVDGVGKDLDSLRKDANALRRRNDDIVAEVESQGARNFAAYEEMDERIKNCKKIKDDALELVRGKDGELHRILLHRDQLQRELDNTVGVLSEERDRCVKLESQLEESEKKLFNLVKSSHDSTLDKLNLIHAAVEDEQSKKDTAEMIEQLRSATQAGGAPQESTMQDIAGIKALIEALDQR
jgi:chromosome segregation ATPase